ncbi:TatD family hydrolase [Endozoicomonas sp. YOMI1]|uniref:TatD family hydrolase n=1 Tax=Endozoicomonas sp. YOMI1 TaxID=2828739 RepID=UPI0021488E24|nr:TatD family hydrolase [Endozoicomonas sp. YOMI1]
MTLQLVDIGVNLSDKAFDKDRDGVVSRAIEHGVTTMILTGTSLTESQRVLGLARKYSEHCFCNAGIHPHEAKDANTQTFKELKALFSEPEVVAVGETGLDFNRDFSPRPVQEKVFERQLELAIDSGLPLFCHERDASQRFADIIKNYRDKVGKLVVHCFTADKTALYRYLDLDCHIGITGWICDERRGTHLHPLMKDIPANRLMVETDSPWLLPRSLAKKPKNRRNEPAFLFEVVQMIATHTGQSPEQVARQTRATSLEFFNLTARHHDLQGQDGQ